MIVMMIITIIMRLTSRPLRHNNNYNNDNNDDNNHYYEIDKQAAATCAHTRVRTRLQTCPHACLSMSTTRIADQAPVPCQRSRRVLALMQAGACMLALMQAVLTRVRVCTSPAAEAGLIHTSPACVRACVHACVRACEP